MGRKPGSKASGAQIEAGNRNLQKWKSENPEGPNYRHGAWTKHIRKRYSDLRTTEGRNLKAIIDGIIDDLGGERNVSNSQRLLLDNIKAKIIVLMQIAQYVDHQESVITPGGELLACLGRGFTAYSEALRRDLQALHEMAKKDKRPDLNSYLEGKYGKR